MLRSEEPECVHGCIFFSNGGLCGDCRVPWSDECRLALRVVRELEEKEDADRDKGRRGR